MFSKVALAASAAALVALPTSAEARSHHHSRYYSSYSVGYYPSYGYRSVSYSPYRSYSYGYSYPSYGYSYGYSYPSRYSRYCGYYRC